MTNNTKKVKYRYIGDIAKHLNISTRAIRYYEELGFITTKRTNGGFREYSDVDAEKLSIVLKLKKLGFPLEEIKELIAMRDCVGDKENGRELLAYLKKRMQKLEERIKEYRDGISEIKKLIGVLEKCDCSKKAARLECEECLKGKEKEMPKLMKAIL